MRTWVDVAELTNTKTLNGGLVARCAPGLPLLLSEGMEIALVPPVLDAPRRVTVAAVQESGVDGAVVRFAEVCDIDAASLLVGCHCLVRRSDIPQDELRFAAPLWEGWEVRDEKLGFVGNVLGIEDRPAQPLLLVSSSDRTVFIPLVEEFLVSIDERKGVIAVDVPAGLLDL